MRTTPAFAATAIAGATALAAVAFGLSASPTATTADAPPGVDTPPAGDPFNYDLCATFVGYPHRCGPLFDPGPQ